MNEVPLGWAFITELMQLSTCMLHAQTHMSNDLTHG